MPQWLNDQIDQELHEFIVGAIIGFIAVLWIFFEE